MSPVTTQSRPRRSLGIDGPELTPLGFGAWATGGPSRFGWAGVDDDESIRAIRFAIESGINWVDTAPFYGKGHSEEVVRRALEPWEAGEDVLIFTKCGRRWEGDDPDAPPHDILTPESIRFECEQSLKRLGVERIDLYQFHRPDETGTPVEDSWGTLLELIEEGKVRWGGVSNFGVDLLERCQRVGHVQSLQPRVNLIDRSALPELLPWCRQAGTGVLAYSPLASGLLTGAWDEERVETLPADDWRKYAKDFLPPKVLQSLKFAAALKNVAEEAGTTLPVLALAWVLRLEGVTAAIVGARNVDQVKGWLPAADAALPDKVWAMVDDLVAGQDRLDDHSMAGVDLEDIR